MDNQVIALIHQVELNIFKMFASIARKYQINYIALGGTMLGSIRHQGFIPWDDDMDVGMLRSDYERFLKIAPEALKSEHYFSRPLGWTRITL